MNSLFIFPEAIHTKDTIALDLDGNRMSFFCNSERVFIDLAALRSGSSTVILKNPITGTVYPLFNFREILQVMDMGPQEFLRVLQITSYMQIDKSGMDTFIKVFLPKGQKELNSRTHDFSRFPHVPLTDLHKLDRAYSWTVRKVKAQIHYGRIEGSLVLERSGFWKEPVYVSHAGQTKELTEGENTFSFSWSPTEDVYCGPKCGRYKGRALHVTPGR
ncbi:hypothetical protein [Acidaminococcus massiliensis]|uniref:hypothetical protein n=1 Tax=Acidaminococcus massiliensis TaxID=1852375 RepID=UPI00094F23AB|nr:hypothetical protein [Acidaminococcus massiliensis]DAL36458.1 MAG TPA_asm: hypothetical protein [Caudoviricetes sp.]